MMAFAVAALVALAAAPVATAGSPNGSYKFVKASGSVTLGGDTTELTSDMIEELGIINKAALQVKNNKVKLDRNAARKLITKLGKELGVPIETSVKGPKTVTLKKSGSSWKGKTSKPVVVKFSTTYEGEKIAGSLRSHFRIKVRGKKMTLETPITGSVLGYKIKAEAVSKFKR